jgi:hypothetical protein
VEEVEQVEEVEEVEKVETRKTIDALGKTSIASRVFTRSSYASAAAAQSLSRSLGA